MEYRACTDCGHFRRTRIYGATGADPWWQSECTICRKRRSIRKHQRAIQTLQAQVLDLQTKRARTQAKKARKS